jgi:quinol monooxygenase YgiN
MSKLSIVARIKAREDALDIVKGELLKLVAPTRKEEGCAVYTLHRDNDNPAVFVFYEIWESGEHLAKHTRSDHFINCFSRIEQLIEELDIYKLAELL